MDPGAASYIERQADADLLAALLAREYVFLLDSRQKGKSSMVARTIVKLHEAGVRTVKLDLQRIGANVTPEQWYAGLLAAIGQELDVSSALFEYWAANQSVGPLARWIGAIKDVVLTKGEDPLVIFVDEVDFVRALPFPTDEFFAAIRDCYNRRADRKGFERLTFCLVGVATPGQLIRNPEITPFNIGTRIEISDFSLEETMAYASALGAHGTAILERIHYWLNGHPYLTQLVCSKLAQKKLPKGPRAVDDIVKWMFLSVESRQNEANLADVERRLLTPQISGADPIEARTQVLGLLQRILRGSRVTYDSENPIIASLRLAGVAIDANGQLKLRNRLYRQIFNLGWSRASMPGAEHRRQVYAARRAALRTALAFAVLLLVVGFAALSAIKSAEVANKARSSSEYEAYCSAMLSASQFWKDNNVAGVIELVRRHQSSPFKGWEWEYWHHLVIGKTLMGDDGKNLDFRWSLDGKSIVARGKSGITWLDASSGRVVRYISSPSSQLSAAFEIVGDRLVDISWAGRIDVWDTVGRRRLWSDQVPDLYWRPNSIVSRDGRFVVGKKRGQLWCYDVQTRQVRRASNSLWDRPTMSPSGKSIAVIANTRNISDSKVLLIRLSDLVATCAIPVGKPASSIQLSSDDRFLFVGFFDGELAVYDVLSKARCFGISLGNTPVWRMDLSRDGRKLSVATAGLVSHFFLVQGENLKPLGRISGCRDAYWSPDGEYLLCFYNHAWVVSFSEACAEEVFTKEYEPDWIDPETSNLFSGSGEELVVHDLRVLQPVPHKIKIGGRSSADTRVDASNRLMAFDSNLGRNWVDPRFGTVVVTSPKGYEKGRICVPLTNGQIVFAGWLFQAEQVMEPRIYDPVKRSFRELPADSPSSVLRSPGGRWVVFCGSTGIVTIWDQTLDRVIRTAEFAPFTMHDGVFIERSSVIVGALDDGHIQVIDLKTGKAIRTLSRHASNARSVALSPDGKRLASGGGDGTVRIWDVETGKMLTVLYGHSREVEHLSFIEGGQTLVSIQPDGPIRRWRTTPYPKKTDAK